MSSHSHGLVPVAKCKQKKKKQGSASFWLLADGRGDINRTQKFFPVVIKFIVLLLLCASSPSLENRKETSKTTATQPAHSHRRSPFPHSLSHTPKKHKLSTSQPLVIMMGLSQTRSGWSAGCHCRCLLPSRPHLRGRGGMRRGLSRRLSRSFLRPDRS